MNFLLVFIIGSIIGSFLNVCIYRIPTNESIVYPASHCTSCKKSLKFYDLIPMVSYVFLRGRCSYCKEKISLIYPFTEVVTAVIFVVLYKCYGFTYMFLKSAILVSFLIVIGMIDYNTTDIYNEISRIGMATGVFWIIFSYFQGEDILNYILGGLLGWSVIAIFIIVPKMIIKKDGMGWGDADICLMCGLYLGCQQIIRVITIAAVLGAIVSIILIYIRRKDKEDYIAFGPYIAIGTFIVTVVGENIIRFY